MGRWQLIATVVLIIVLPSCRTTGLTAAGNGAVQQANRNLDQRNAVRQARTEAIGDPAQVTYFRGVSACVKRVAQNPEYSRLDEKSPDFEKIKYANLTDPSLANDEERTMIARFMAEADKCYQVGTYSTDDRLVGKVARLMDDIWTTNLLLMARLYNREITWGRFNDQMTSAMMKFRADMRQIQQNVQGDVATRLALFDAVTEREQLLQTIKDAQRDANRARAEAESARMQAMQAEADAFQARSCAAKSRYMKC